MRGMILNMKIFNKIGLVLVLLIIGYIIGSYIPITGFFRTDSMDENADGGIIGNAELNVTVLRSDKSPVVDIEVDIAIKPGPPLRGGAVKTDSNGIASFNIKPGTYYIFFNDNNFPVDLEYRDMAQVTAEEGKVTSRTIILHPKD
jgi:hypothetical protein